MQSNIKLKHLIIQTSQHTVIFQKNMKIELLKMNKQCFTGFSKTTWTKTPWAVKVTLWKKKCKTAIPISDSTKLLKIKFLSG